MIAMGAKRRVRVPGAAKRPNATDQVVASASSSGSTSANPNKTNQPPAKATTAAQSAPVRVAVKPVASEAISEQKTTSDADAELTARAERVREKLWNAGKQKGAQQKALQENMKQIEAEAAQTAKQEALAKAEAAQTAKQEALAKAEAARKAVEELLAEEEQAAHQAAAKKAKKDRRKAKKQQQQEEGQLQRRQQQEQELLQRQQQEEEEQQKVQQEMRHQQQLQEEQELQQQKQARQQAQKLQQQNLQEQLQGQVLQQKLQPQVQELHEGQTPQEWQEQQQQQQKQQRSVEQPSLQVHTQQTGHAAGGSNTGTAANTVSASKNSAAEQTEPLLSPELMHVKQSSGLARQTAKTVRLDHAEPSQCVIGQHSGGVPNVDHRPATRQQKRFATPHHLLCCPITQVCCFLLYDLLVLH